MPSSPPCVSFTRSSVETFHGFDEVNARCDTGQISFSQLALKLLHVSVDQETRHFICEVASIETRHWKTLRASDCVHLRLRRGKSLERALPVRMRRPVTVKHFVVSETTEFFRKFLDCLWTSPESIPVLRFRLVVIRLDSLVTRVVHH